MTAPPDVTRAAADHAAWNRKHRGESDVQRLDRNFVELLQEFAAIPGIAGAHIMAPQNPSAIPEVIEASGVTKS